MYDSQTANPSSINWQSNLSKRAQDVHIQNYIAPLLNQDKVTVLSLPAATWSFETNLAASYPLTTFKFIGIEADVIVEGRMRKHAAMLNADPYNRNLDTVFHPFGQAITVKELLDLNSGEGMRLNPFDLVYLDYMGTWNRERAAELTQLFKQGLVGQYLVLTFSLIRGQPQSNNALISISKTGNYHTMSVLTNATVRCTMGEDTTSQAKFRGIPLTVQELASNAGLDLRFKGARAYDSLSKGGRKSVSPEAFFVFENVT